MELSPSACSHHSVITLYVQPAALSDWLQVTSNRISTLEATVPQTGEETVAPSGAVSKGRQHIAEVALNFTIL